jgi:co-chaperonin GroES (HSP10)
MIAPTKDRVLVREDVPDHNPGGSLIIIESAPPDVRSGIVIALGPVAEQSGEIRLGDRVHYRRMCGIETAGGLLLEYHMIEMAESTLESR